LHAGSLLTDVNGTTSVNETVAILEERGTQLSNKVATGQSPCMDQNHGHLTWSYAVD